MRKLSGALGFAVLVLFALVPGFVDQPNDVLSIRKSFLALKSVHADVVSSNGTIAAFDFVGGNKMHETLPQGVEIVWIVPDVWESINGTWRKLPIHGGFQEAVLYVRTLGLENGDASRYTVRDPGKEVVNGIETQKYHVVERQTGRVVDIWVDANRMPVKVQGMARRDGAVMTITYSEYNTVADIGVPH
jgi:hypothetical protein